MRLIVWIAALGLIALPATAGTGATGAGGSSATTSSATAAAPAAQPSSAPAASSKAAPAATPATTDTESELQQLRALIEAQTRQLQEQNDQLREQQQKMQELEDQINASSSGTSSTLAAAPVAAVAPAIGVPTASVFTTEPADPANSRRSVSLNPGVDGYGGMDNPDQPTSIHYKGITLTPGGFMAAETSWRQKALGSDVNSAFNNTPFDGQSQSHVTEFFGTGRQSRIAMLFEGKLSDVKIGGYYEMDFLSAGTTSNNNQSNSYTMRQRQFWAQAAFNNGFTITGGQQWSLITETTHGMDNRTEALPMNIDAQYNVGFSWARQYGLRLTKNFGNKVWLGFSVENPQATVTVHGNPTVTSGGTEVPATTCTTINVVTNTCTAIAVSATSASVVNPTTTVNFLFGTYGIGGGLYNPAANYSFNPSPDFIVKAVFEPGFGHYEIFGLASEFRDRVFPCVPPGGGTVAPSGSGFPSTTPPGGCTSVASAQFARNTNAPIGGGGANARWSLFAKKMDFGLHFFGGIGIGRYGSVGLADATVRPNGSVVPLHNYQSLVTLQFHPTKKWDIYLLGGDEYEGRATYSNNGKAEGYGGKPGLLFNNSGCWSEVEPTGGPASNSLGVPTGLGGSSGFIPGGLSNCTGDTRNMIEGTIGFWYRFYAGPKGRVQLGMEYSNIYRETWAGTGGGAVPPLSESGQPHSDNNMVFTSFRYYLP
ncbi:MAG: FlxA-like family protein [Candidatus Acidiferrales bacterium]